MKRHICFITGSRAEYGLLQPLIKTVAVDKTLQYSIICTGMHLSPEFGLTYSEIEEDGFIIHKKIEMLLSSDSSIGMAKSIGLGIIGFADVISEIKPDITVLLGDRFEIYAAATAAYVSKVPIAHIHGGEITKGSLDDGFRHSITKMSSLHFTSTEDYRNRVIQLGEAPERVFNVGALGVENIQTMQLLSEQELCEELHFNFSTDYFLVSFHPATLDNIASEQQFENLLNALGKFPNYSVVFTKTNADDRGRVINAMIDSYTSLNKGRCISFTSMGQKKFLSAMKYSNAVIGNSSSGIIEAPSLMVPTVNIGSRQLGRIKADSIIDCLPELKDVIRAIKKAISEDYHNKIHLATNPYECDNTSENIKSILKNYYLKDINLKNFYDIKCYAH